MKKLRTFKVVFEQDDGGWHARIPEVRGCGTWGKTLGLARRNIREALSTCVDVLGENVERIAAEAEFIEEIVWPAKVKSMLDVVVAARQRLEREEASTRALSRKAVGTLKGLGFSVRDTAAVLGMSYQRIHQISTDEPRAESRSVATAARGSVRSSSSNHAPKRRRAR